MEMIHSLIVLLYSMVFVIRGSELTEHNATLVDESDSTPLKERQIVVENPCNCYFQDSCGCICSRRISWEQFQVLPQNFRPCRSFTLALRGGQFHSFPADYFYRVGYVKDFVLDVSNLALQYLNDLEGESSPYNGVTFEVSAFLRMHEVSVQRGWNWGALYWLSPTSSRAYCEIQVIRSTVPLLQADFGRICQGMVTVVNVISSGLQVLENRVFSPFQKLNELDLSNNRIQDMRRSLFAYPARDLELINLANNNIRALSQDMFSQMPSLKSVNLRGNPITNLDERTFRPIFHTVEIVGLESIPLSCDCKSLWLKEPAQLYGVNVFGLAEATCGGPTDFKGYSFFNDSLSQDLIC